MDENGIVNDGEMEVLSDEEIEAFLKDLHTERTSICYMMEFALWTFMRTGEIKALQYKDVDMERGEIKIYKSYGRVRKEGSYTKEGCTAMGYEWRLLEPKTKKSKRVFKMSPMAIEALENHLRMIRSKRPDILDSDGNIRPETFIFSTTNGKPYADQNINQLLKTSLKKAGVIKDISFHGLRHSGISYFLRHGADLRIISSLAGHSDVSTTLNIYYNLVREQIDRAYDMEYWKKIS